MAQTLLKAINLHTFGVQVGSVLVVALVLSWESWCPDASVIVFHCLGISAGTIIMLSALVRFGPHSDYSGLPPCLCAPRMLHVQADEAQMNTRTLNCLHANRLAA